MSTNSPTAETFEKIPTVIHDTPAHAVKALAEEIRDLILSRQGRGHSAVLGLATGSTPVPLYRELIRLHREENLSFHNVVTFNLDEYHGLDAEHPESYYRFMRDQLFDHVDIPLENVHIPQGMVSREKIFEHCREYEAKIVSAGGVDLQILGIGRTGHIGFNEPGSSSDSVTRRITLDRITRQDAAADFKGEGNVPRFAITMGVGTILRARKLVLMAWGESKAAVVARAVEGPVTDAVSASFLQEHANARFFIDRFASSELTRVKLPWLVGPMSWTPREIRRAVCWLSSKLNRPVLKLTDEDYNEHGLGDLLSEMGPAYQLNIRIFNQLQHTISGWPGGKPAADETHRPERASPFPKRCLVLSPEPQDAIVNMGSTINRLVEQGHQVHLVCMTAGSLRVPDSEAEKFASTLLEVGADNSELWDAPAHYAAEIMKILEGKEHSDEDALLLRRLKGIILRGEVRDAAHVLGLANVTFLELPFYENGRYRRFSLEQADIEKTVEILKEFAPNQIYFTGSVSDPSSVSALCHQIVEQAFSQEDMMPLRSACSSWVYRSKEKPLEAWEITMAMPISPMQLERKAEAMNCFQSLTNLEKQSLHGNRECACWYDSLGLANYEAIESFQRKEWK